MNDTPLVPYDYQSEGGALLIDAPTYVKRKADDELYEGLKAGQFCYVLNARQMGKSSLKVRTLQRLRNEGIACAAVDLQGIGTSATEEQWYFGVVSRIARSLGLHRQFNLNTWWTEQPRLSYVQRFVEFLESLVLPSVPQPIVIFIDEVDLTLSLSFRDDFFGALRESYNRRADEPEYRRLTFALFGVATPSDLIQNKQITPFNIGRPIDLTGFQWSEAQPLMLGLIAKTSHPQALLQAILDWTGGQPFLTQKLCKLAQVADSEPLAGRETQWVKQLVQTKVIDNWETQDIPPHLKTIRDRLLLSGEQRTGRLLGLYQQILQQGEIAADDSPEQVELRLTGLVVKRDGKLRVYNCIYEQVFNRDWLERSLAELRPYGGAIAAWLESGCQDESRLLRGQALQDARTWAEGKSLGDEDRRFLDASQESEKRNIQKKLAAEEEAKQVLAIANLKANRRIRIGSVVLGTMLLGAIVLGMIVQQKILLANRTVDDSTKRVENLRQEAEEVSKKLEITEEQRQLAQLGQRSAKAETQQVNRTLAKARTRLEIANTKINTTEQDIEKANLKLVNLEKEVGISNQQRQRAVQELEIAKSKAGKAKEEQNQAQEGLKTAEMEITSRKEELEKLNTYLSRSQDELRLAQQAVVESVGDTPARIMKQTGQKPAVIYISFYPSREGRKNLGLLMVSAEGQFSTKLDSVDQEEALKAAHSFRDEVFTGSKEHLIPAQTLYQWIIKPLELELKRQNITNLVLIVDKSLRNIPFAALHDGQGYLIEKYSLGIMPGLTLTNSHHRNIRNSNVLAIGVSKSNLESHPMPHVKNEIISIMTFWKGKSFLDEEATLDKLKSREQNFHIVHIAGVGYERLSGRTREPFIELWGSVLKSSNFEQVDWYSPPVELLVLSSSVSGLGEEYGLAGSAIQAGVKSVLGSLYGVSDEETMILMDEFYRNLKNSPIKAEALRQAQLSMIKEEDFSSPRYWAGFTIIGNPW
ncbi:MULTISPECIES: CHAT domain-containing protein [Trichocoleus]|uniref:CHAT domain-containing protein n=1 Tax=Trichocoleus desertorum GB2-A4 TaxID=2933944 RepID=A0ABV0JFV5_9CYAN|nr:CHAT domain-containing protein [Trichocoleus sp. FACHB-46]MBD1865147.1 CHAT domain-containing protein [Trichocoleus sp. FACHB-46]